MREGKRLLGRQIMYLIDQHFKITEADGAVYDIEHLLSVTMNNDKLQAFLCTWDTVLSGLRAQPDKSMLEALFLRQIRGCEAMEQDLAYYDRLAQDDAHRSYDYLIRCCRRVIARNRLTWARTELSKSIANGGRALVNKDQDKPRGRSKGKGKKDKGK